MGDSTGGTIAERAADRLAPFLGPHTARTAVKTFTQRARAGPGDADARRRPRARRGAGADAPGTLVGKDRGEAVVRLILREFGL